MTTLLIRHEKSKDIKEIYSLLQEAFGRPDEADLVDPLRCAANGYHFLAHAIRHYAPWPMLLAYT
jgi:predicted N-acetyltransferase YhbS